MKEQIREFVAAHCVARKEGRREFVVRPFFTEGSLHEGKV
jgi:hypothetical protein